VPPDVLSTFGAKKEIVLQDKEEPLYLIARQAYQDLLSGFAERAHGIPSAGGELI
jgi:hypothetical protein